MSSERVFNVPQLFLQVLDGCRQRNSITINRALQTLIRRGGGSMRFAGRYVQLYHMCLLYLKRNEIDEIRKTFDRLISGWTAALMTMAGRKQVKRILDVEIEQVSEDMLILRTEDADIAGRMQKIHGVRLDTIEKLLSGKSQWILTVKRNRLPRIVEKLRKPHYLEFLDKQYSRQLSFEF